MVRLTEEELAEICQKQTNAKALETYYRPFLAIALAVQEAVIKKYDDEYDEWLKKALADVDRE